MPDKENELCIKFKTDEEWDLLTLLRVKAHSESLSVEQYVLNELKKYVEFSAPPPPENPVLSPTQLNEVLRRIGNVDMSSRGEIAKLRREVAVLAEALAKLAEGVAAMQAQLDGTT